MSMLEGSRTYLCKKGPIVNADRSSSIRFRVFFLRLARSALYRPICWNGCCNAEVMDLQWIVEEHIAKTKTENINKMNFDNKRFSFDSLSKLEESDSGFSDG